MREWPLYRIRDAAWASGRSVFSVQQLANLIGKPKPVAAVYASRLVRAGLAIRIRRGSVSFEDDEQVIATQLMEPSYVSLTSALRLRGLTTQAPALLECATTRNSLALRKLGIVYHKIPPSLLFGFKKHPKGRSYVMIAEPAKAVLDGIYLRRFSQKDIKEIPVDRQELQQLAGRFRGRGSRRLRRLARA